MPSRKWERARLRRIILVLVKHGLRRGAVSPAGLRRALEELGPTFVKFGQLLSASREMIPENYRHELQKLQDDVRPEDPGTIMAAGEKSLGQPISEIFAYFSPHPLASASISQVHRAKLPGGEDVVLKIQRPGIRETMLSDLHLMRRLARFLRLVLGGRVIDPASLVDELLRNAEMELDFRREADNLERFTAYNRGDDFLVFPTVHREYLRREVLVLSYLEGIKLPAIDRIEAAGLHRTEIGRRLAANYCKQVFGDGFFHADPHPGNLLLVNGHLAYLDFGIVGELPAPVRERFNRVLYAVGARDTSRLTGALLGLMNRRGPVDPARLRGDLQNLCDDYLDLPLADLDLGSAAEKIWHVCRDNNVSVPRELTMLLKGLITLEGTLSRLSPDLNLMEIAQPFIEKQLRRQGDLRRQIKEEFTAAGLSSLRLPARLYEVLNLALAGRLRVQFEHSNLEKSLRELGRMANRLAFAVITAALIVGSSLIVQAEIGPKLFGLSALGVVGYIGAACLGLWLLISILRGGMI